MEAFTNNSGKRKKVGDESTVAATSEVLPSQSSISTSAASSTVMGASDVVKITVHIPQSCTIDYKEVTRVIEVTNASLRTLQFIHDTALTWDSVLQVGMLLVTKEDAGTPLDLGTNVFRWAAGLGGATDKLTLCLQFDKKPINIVFNLSVTVSVSPPIGDKINMRLKYTKRVLVMCDAVAHAVQMTKEDLIFTWKGVVIDSNSKDSAILSLGLREGNEIDVTSR